MPSALLDSQLACLDPPAADERVITIGIAARPAEMAAVTICRLCAAPRAVRIGAGRYGSRLFVGTSAWTTSGNRCRGISERGRRSPRCGRCDLHRPHVAQLATLCYC